MEKVSQIFNRLKEQCHNSLFNENLLSQKALRDMNVICILDEFSYECFKHECNLIQITPGNYMDILNSTAVDMLLVESAWIGDNGKWCDKIANLEDTNDPSLRDLVHQCRERRIPTVFWNKEDPMFFNSFIDAAKLFDYVFTTDENSLDRYKSKLQHSRIEVLPFAAQPKIHNPMGRNQQRLGTVAFAGTWYGGVPHRVKSMEMLLEPSIEYGIHIYDRMKGQTEDKSFTFPSKYEPYIKGCLSYEEITEYYKFYDVFLNANLIIDSPTMFSRRVFELLACGTNIISSYALGIEKNFSRIVKQCNDREDVKKYLDILLNNKELRDRISLIGQRKIFDEHTYRHRLYSILNKTQFSYKEDTEPGVSIISIVDKPEYIEKVMKNFYRQSFKNKELILMLNCIDRINEKDLKKQLSDDIHVIFLESKHNLGTAINTAATQTKYEYLSVFDPQDYYAPNFIKDLMNTFKYSEVDIACKGSYYIYLPRYKALAIRTPNREYEFIDQLDSFSFILKKQRWNQIYSSDREEDVLSILSENCIRENIRVFSTDRFNYVHVLRFASDKSYEDEYLQSSEIVLYVDDFTACITV
ncbi:glycosyltransferase family protein [Anaerosolibacter sp.]|uniref:glycosyltransferase family protein n=1 Tax=Anaerosolibacter sp. TaxID=1872527 RepID=UPI0026351310|nr:glycosyltransferase [Anaerosolibacter sp.]